MYLQHACQRTKKAMKGSNLACNPEQLEYPAKPMITDYSRQGSDFACNLEQLEYPARPMTPGAEERDDPVAGDAALYRQLFTDLL